MIGGVSGCRERRVGGLVSLTGSGQPACDCHDLTDADDLTVAEAVLTWTHDPHPRRDEPRGWIRVDAWLRPRRWCQDRPRSSSRISPSFRYAARCQRRSRRGGRLRAGGRPTAPPPRAGSSDRHPGTKLGGTRAAQRVTGWPVPPGRGLARPNVTIQGGRHPPTLPVDSDGGYTRRLRSPWLSGDEGGELLEASMVVATVSVTDLGRAKRFYGRHSV